MDYATARRHMVDGQLLPNEVNDERVVDAMATLPRELFVPEAMRGIAYVDDAVPLGDGRYLMEPMVLGRLLELAEARSGDVALIVGCATGYSAAVMSRLCDTVVGVESNKDMKKKAEDNLSTLGIDNVAIVEGPLGEGYPKQAPYDVILIDGQVPEPPKAIEDQLADGGRLVAVTGSGEPGMMGTAVLANRYHGVVSHWNAFDAGSPLLPGFEKPKTFVF